MTTDRLPDRWHSRDFPVLLETARLLDAGSDAVQGDELAPIVSLAPKDVQAAWEALARGESTSYLEATRFDGTLAESDGELVVVGLTERGRRAVGLWPSGEAADALVEALRQAEDAVTDPEEKTVLRRAAGAVGSVSRDVMVDVMAAVVARQSGIG